MRLVIEKADRYDVLKSLRCCVPAASTLEPAPVRSRIAELRRKYGDDDPAEPLPPSQPLAVPPQPLAVPPQPPAVPPILGEWVKGDFEEDLVEAADHITEPFDGDDDGDDDGGGDYEPSYM